jgi:hypothetical protein
MFDKLLAIIAFLFCLLSIRAKAANDSIVAHAQSQALTTEAFSDFCRTQNYDSLKMAMAIKHGIYVPESQNCGSDIPVFTNLTFSFDEIEKDLKQDSAFNALLAYTATMYKLIPEPFKMSSLLPANVKEIDYSNVSLSCQSIFDSLSTGAWAFDCGGHAAMAKIFLDSLGGKKYISKTVQLARKNGDAVNHIVTLVYYRQDNIWYGATLDCQNGKIGPVAKEDSFLSIARQKEILESGLMDSLRIISIAESDLRNKRNLMNQALYCNILPDSGCIYRAAYPQSGYKYERLTYSTLHYTWFKAGSLNLKNYEQNLLTLLVKNAPEN